MYQLTLILPADHIRIFPMLLNNSIYNNQVGITKAAFINTPLSSKNQPPTNPLVNIVTIQTHIHK